MAASTYALFIKDFPDDREGLRLNILHTDDTERRGALYSLNEVMRREKLKRRYQDGLRRHLEEYERHIDGLNQLLQEVIAGDAISDGIWSALDPSWEVRAIRTHMGELNDYRRDLERVRQSIETGARFTHAYAVRSAFEAGGQRLIQLYNPHADEDESRYTLEGEGNFVLSLDRFLSTFAEYTISS